MLLVKLRPLQRSCCRERDDGARGAAEVTEPIEVFVFRDRTDELGAMCLHAGDDVVDVVDGEHDATQAERVRWCVRLGGRGRRVVELGQLEPAVTVGRRAKATST